MSSKEYHREWRLKNKEKVKAAQAKYRANHLENACYRCNTALGMIRESPALTLRLYNYIMDHCKTT